MDHVEGTNLRLSDDGQEESEPHEELESQEYSPPTELCLEPEQDLNLGATSCLRQSTRQRQPTRIFTYPSLGQPAYHSCLLYNFTFSHIQIPTQA